MEVTFELTQEMIENELLSIYYNTFSFRGYSSYIKSPLGCNFIANEPENCHIFSVASEWL